MSLALADALVTGLAALAVPLDGEAKGRLLDYLALLSKWNTRYNLTAIRELPEMLSRHVLDSLAVLPWLDRLGQGEDAQNSALVRRREGAESWRLADVGSGAGIPGLILAIARPQWRVTSIEAVDKKAAFQRQACIELGLGNVRVIGGRVEQQAAGSVDAVISRAFASLADFARLAGHLPVEGGYLLAMKGLESDDELSALPAAWRLAASHRLQVPTLDAQRHLFVLEKG